MTLSDLQEFLRRALNKDKTWIAGAKTLLLSPAASAAFLSADSSRRRAFVQAASETVLAVADEKLALAAQRSLLSEALARKPYVTLFTLELFGG